MRSLKEVPTMTHPWDEFSKSLAEEVPRRESLRRLGAVLAGAVLGPLAAGTARAGGKGKPGGKGGPDPCKAICQCSNKRQQDACLAACRSCTGPTRRLCGSCGNGIYCTDLADDPNNCGACGNVWQQGPNDEVPRDFNHCAHSLAEGATLCNRCCIPLR